MNTIKLTTKQLEIFNKYQTEKQSLQAQFQLITKMENDFVTTVFESAGKEIVEGIKFEDGSFVIPETVVEKSLPKKSKK